MKLGTLLTIRNGAAAFGRVRRTHGVSIASQLIQWREAHATCGMSRSEFHQYRLWRPELDQVARFQFVCRDERRRTGRLVAPLAARAFTHQKLLTRARLADHQIATPDVLALIDPARSPDPGVLGEPRELADLLERAPPHGLVFKADQGMQGSQVVVAARSDRTGLWEPDGQFVALATLWHRITAQPGERWFVEPRLRRDAGLPAWAGDLISTLRLFTLHVGGAPRLHAATLKIPITLAGTDNMSRGNLGAPVELDTGRIGSARTLDQDTLHERHPISGGRIAGLTVPGWPAAVELVLRAAPLVMPLRVVGWDVALTESGPVLLEGNVPSAESVVQVPQDIGMLRGWYLELLREVGAEASLTRRRASIAWRSFEARERDWCAGHVTLATA